MPDRNDALKFLRWPDQVQPEIIRIHSGLFRGMRLYPELFLSTYENEDTKKKMIYADIFAELRFREIILDRCGDSVSVEGEESLGITSLDLSSSSKIHILCDIIDGTDLMIRDFSNWCSAFVVFDPTNANIISSYVYSVGNWHDALYSSVDSNNYVLVRRYAEIAYADDANLITKEPQSSLEWSSIDNTKSLEEATICSYGQKLENQFAISDFFTAREVRNRFNQSTSMRFYNIAGNPMMCRLLDGAMDVVFDLCGQAPHDVVPGAYIALKAGACMYDLRETPLHDDRRLHINDLPHFLFQPSLPENRLKYVIAANDEMASEFVNVVREGGWI